MNCPEEGGVAGTLSEVGAVPTPAPLTVTLPPLPDLASIVDLPALPVLPSLDPTQLLKPITDLLGVFGTGALGAAPGGDPAVAHQQIAQVLENGVGTLLNAAQSLDGNWLGQAATSAITAATRTAGESGVLAAQGTGMSIDLQAAAAVVAAGALELQGVVAKTAGLLSATLPAIATPPGQIAALAIAADGLAEGLAVVSATRAQLIPPTAQMTANGAPVPITGVPGSDGFGTASKILESVVPLVQAGAQFATSLLTGAGLDGSTPVGEMPQADQPASTTTTPTSACPTTCEKSTAGSTTTSPRTGSPAPVVKAASATSTGAPTTVGVAAPAPAPAPTPLADCPTTTNASTVGTTTPGAAAPQMTTVGSGTAMPMAPLAASAARASDTTRPITTVPAATTVSQQPVEPEWLTRMTSESLDIDVALALGIGDQDLAGSA